jgi:plastocyanin
MSPRRALTLGLGAAAVAAVTAGAGASAARLPSEGGSAKAPARLLVYAQEWSLWPSRPSLKAGTVVVQLWNRGQDAHDLRIRRLSRGAMVGRTQGDAITQSGKVSQATWRLSPGTYELYCSMPDHLKRGMHTRITVR